MKAKELAEILLKRPDAEVVFDDCNIEYAYQIVLQDVKAKSVVLTWGINSYIRDEKTGELTEA